MVTLTSEMRFAADYLVSRGLSPSDLLEAAKAKKATDTFIIVKTEDNFFTQLAIRLRDMWPSGNKDGKYPWKDPEEVIASRLKACWCAMKLSPTLTLDECVSAAQKYLSRFEENTKYMQTLKYFILKYKSVGNKQIPESQFAAILKSSEFTEEDIEALMNSNNMLI